MEFKGTLKRRKKGKIVLNLVCPHPYILEIIKLLKLEMVVLLIADPPPAKLQHYANNGTNVANLIDKEDIIGDSLQI